MTIVYGIYADCGLDGGFGLELNCTGDGCGEFQTFPTLKCTNSSNSAGGITTSCNNGVTCQDTNLTSSFAIFGSGANYSLQANQTVFGTPFQLTLLSNNTFTVVNETASPVSSAAPTTSPGSKNDASLQRAPHFGRIFKLMLVWLFTWMMFQPALAGCIPGISNLANSVPPYFRNFVENIMGRACNAGVDIIINKVGQASGSEYWAFFEEVQATCIEAVTEADLPLLGIEIGTNPLVAVGTELVIAYVCNKFAMTLLLGGLEKTGQIACGDILSAFSSEAASQCSTSAPSPIPAPVSSIHASSSTPSPSVASPTPTSAPASGLTIPSVAGDNCASCQLSGYAIGLIGLAQQCHVAVPLGIAFDVSVLLCDSSYGGKYASFCKTLCANQCATYNINDWIQSAGSSYMSNANLAVCSSYCPGFKGDGRCQLADSCGCGVGALICVPC
jgi:hypothetical protein